VACRERTGQPPGGSGVAHGHDVQGQGQRGRLGRARPRRPCARVWCAGAAPSRDAPCPGAAQHTRRRAAPGGTKDDTRDARLTVLCVGVQEDKKVEDSDPELGPMTHLDVPSTFQGWCSLISRVLAPAEELSPFKLGQIQKLIADINADAGLFVAPAFVTGQILFLIAFAIYLVLAIVALVADFGAFSDGCATESWVWLFVLLAVAIPSGLGFVMSLVKTGLNMANLKRRFGWEVPPMLLSFPGPVLYVVLGIFGILLWAQMSDGCAGTYASSYGLLFIIFKIQVIMFGIAAIFGAITTFSQTIVFFNSLNPEDPDLTALKKKLDDAEGDLKQAEKDYVQGAEQIVAKLKKQVAEAERERDDAKAQLKAESEEPFNFGEMSSTIVKYLVRPRSYSPARPPARPDRQHWRWICILACASGWNL